MYFNRFVSETYDFDYFPIELSFIDICLGLSWERDLYLMEYQNEANVVRSVDSLNVQYSVMDYPKKWVLYFNNYTYISESEYHNECGFTIYDSDWQLTPQQ